MNWTPPSMAASLPLMALAARAEICWLIIEDARAWNGLANGGEIAQGGYVLISPDRTGSQDRRCLTALRMIDGFRAFFILTF